jgi:hypothetical protein
MLQARSAALPASLGYAEEELLDRLFLSFIHPADAAATRAALEKLARGEPALGLKNRFRCKDASYPATGLDGDTHA